MNPPTHTRTLSTAEERRSTLVAAALPIFAEQGYRAASTVAIAGLAIPNIWLGPLLILYLWRIWC